MVDWIVKLFDRSNKSSTIKLVIKYQDLVIGKLWFDGENYIFVYEKNFENSNLAPITGFRDFSKTYKSPILFPFFEARIPDLDREEVIEIMKSHNLTKQSPELALLSKLGRKTVNDPYELTVEN